MTMAECQTVTVTTVVVTVTVVMVVEVVVKSTRSTTSPLWGIETSVMGSKMFKKFKLVKRSSREHEESMRIGQKKHSHIAK